MRIGLGSPLIKEKMARAKDDGGFSPLSLSPALWLKADAGCFTDAAGTTPAAADADLVALWQDQSGSGGHYSQAVDTRRPSRPLAEKNGLPVIRSDGTDDRLTSTLLSLASGSFTVYAALKPTARADDILFDTQTGRLIVSTNGPNTRLGWYDGNWKEVISPTETAWQVVSWVLTAGGNGEIFKNGVSQGTLAYAAKAIGGTSSLFAAYGGGSEIQVDLGEFLIFPSAHSATDRERVESYLSTRWQIPF